MPQGKQTEQQKSERSASGVKQAPVRRVPRSQINPAPYNPRTLSEYARKQLAESLKRFGLVETLVWNERTGVLVSGHQRLSIMDRESGYPERGDYEIEVSVVDLDEKHEKQLNVWLNNRSAQGTFERDALAQLMESGVSLDDIGFTRIDLELEFGSLDGFDGILEREKKASDPIKKDVQAIKDRKKEVRGENEANPSEDADYYVLVCFNSAREKEEFLRRAGFPLDARFVTAAEMFLAANGATCPQSAVILEAVNRVRRVAGDPQMKMARAMELLAADYIAGVE
jgi:hypothetical protein